MKRSMVLLLTLLMSVCVARAQDDTYKPSTLTLPPAPAKVTSQTIALVGMAHPQWVTVTNPQGIAPWIVNGEQYYSAHPWGDVNVPSIDEIIAGGRGYCIMWMQAWNKDQPYPSTDHQGWAGYDAWGGVGQACEMRGPEYLNMLELRIPGFWEAARKRNDICAARGLIAMIYTGSPNGHVFDGVSSQKRTALLRDWAKLPVQSRFGVWGMDVSGWVAYKSPCHWFGEYLMTINIEPYLETNTKVHPLYHGAYNGKWNCVSTLDWFNRSQTGDPGWYPKSCWKYTFMVTQMNANDANDQQRREAAIKSTVPDQVQIVDFGGLLPWSKWQAATAAHN